MRLISSIATALAVVIFIALGVFAQSDITTHFSPFLIDVTQAVPAEVTITLPNADGETITTTVPLTVSVNLRVSVEGPYSATVTTPTTPTVAVTPIEPTTTSTDDLGYAYQLAAIDSNLEIIEWTAYLDSNGHLNFAGEIRNTSTDQRLSFAAIVVRLYRADGTLLSIEDYGTGGHWVDSSETDRFKGSSYAAPNDLDHYTIEIKGQDWQPLP